MPNIWKSFKNPNLPTDYFRVEVIILRCLGIELYEEETFWYGVYSKIVLFNTVFTVTAMEGYEFFMQWGDLNTIAAVTNYLLTHIMGTIETVLLYINRKKIGRMMLSLHKPPYEADESRGGKIEAEWIRQAIKITEIMYVLFAGFLLLTEMSGVLEILHVRLTKPQSEWKMAFAPLSIGEFQKHSPFFEISAFYQWFTVSAFGFIILTTYLLNASIMAHISVQMKIVANGLRSMRPRACQLASPSTDESIVNKHMDILMRNSINHHLDVLNLAAEMESLCSLMILSVIGCSVILMCFLLYFASLFPVNSVEFFHFFFYWWCIFCQVASYCYWGNEVSLEAENVAKAAAEIEWPGASKHVTNAVLMMITRAQRPLYITAGKFVPLSMENLMMIVKGSVSYFMVLKQTQEELHTNEG